MGFKSLVSVCNVRDLLKSNLFFSSSYTVLIIGLYTSISTYFMYRSARERFAAARLHRERSNCVVMYAAGSMSGWPPSKGRVAGIECIKCLFEPLVYFIDNATKTLDVAVMIFNVNRYMEALERAKRRGVVIRVITQFEKQSTIIPKLIKVAQDVMLYVPDKDITSSLLHYKYIVRDYGLKNQCVCFGSMNFTVTGATDNFENLVFTQINTIITKFKENHDHCSDLLHPLKQDYYKKAILKNAGYM